MSADPVGNRRNDIGSDDEERIIHLPQSAGENNEEESNGEDEGEGDDGLEAGGRHLGRWCLWSWRGRVMRRCRRRKLPVGR